MALAGRLLAWLQFGSAGMLLWGLAAAVPVIIHLWSRATYRQEPWAAMSFLLAALQKNSRRLQLQQWLLLALRMAILLLFALALANPQFTTFPAWKGTDADGVTNVVLVIDGSYSMDYRQEGRSRFDAAKEAAKKIAESAAPNDRFMLVLMGQPPHAVIAEPTSNRLALLEELDGLEMSHTGASLPATLAEVEVVLRRARQRSVRRAADQAKVYFLTDLQQATWGEWDSPDCRARLIRLESLALMELVDLGIPSAGNLAVARVIAITAEGGAAVIHSPVQIQAEIQNFSKQNRPQAAVEMFVDSQRIADERADVPAGSRAGVSVTHRFDAPGDHIVEAKLSGDALPLNTLPLDDRRWLVVPVREATRVLCIGGGPGETKHLRLALAPKNGKGNIEVAEAFESGLQELDLARFDCLFLSNIGRFSQGEAAALHNFVNRGGGLIIFLGDHVQEANYNQLLVDDAATRLLPARLVKLAPTLLEGYLLDPLDYRHPIVAPFRGFTQAGLLTTPVWKYMKLAPLPDSVTALAFNNDEAAIVEGRIGRGRSILVATAASPESLDRSLSPPAPWTALSSWPSFPPLVHEMLRLTLATKTNERNIQIGEELTGSFAAAATEARVTLTGPGGISETLATTRDGAAESWSFGTPARSGIYTVERGGEKQSFAVNLNPQEGNLTRIDPELLPSHLHYGPQSAVDHSAAPIRTGSVNPFRWLLGAVIALLLLEPLLACQFAGGFA